MPPRPPLTHFLCIPLVTATSRQQISANLSSFRADVTSAVSFGIPEQAIRPVSTLHLTLGVMSLPKDEGLEKAVALLKTIMPRQILAEIVPTRPSTSGTLVAEARGPPPPFPTVTLKGLHSMQSAAKASVLYAPPVDPEGVLRRFCEKLRATFQEAGFMEEDTRPLLLHATILNTIYVKGRRGKERGRMTIDARQILDRYDDYVWVEGVPIEKIAICKMGAKQLDDGDAAYEVVAEIDVV